MRTTPIVKATSLKISLLLQRQLKMYKRRKGEGSGEEGEQPNFNVTASGTGPDVHHTFAGGVT